MTASPGSGVLQRVDGVLKVGWGAVEQAAGPRSFIGAGRASVCSGAFGNGSSRSDLIPDHHVEAAAAMIDSTGIAAHLEQWRAEDRAGQGPGGRPASLDDRAVLVCFVLLALEHSPLLVTRMAETIAHRLSDKAKALLGIDPAETAEKDWYDRTWRTIHSLLDVIDPFPAKGKRNRLLTKAEMGRCPRRPRPGGVRPQASSLDWVCNELLEATLRMIPRDIRRRWKGNLCIDATPVAAFGKRGTTKRSDLVSIEPDAAWYVREGDHRDPVRRSRQGVSQGDVGVGDHSLSAVHRRPERR